jgi:hypothetical protein
MSTIKDAEGLIGVVVTLGAIGLLIWVGYKWGKGQTPASQPDGAGGGLLDSLQEATWGANYAPPSTGSVPGRINETLWGSGANTPTNPVDQFFAFLDKWIGPDDQAQAGQSDQPAGGVQLPYGNPPADLNLVGSFDQYGPPEGVQG